MEIAKNSTKQPIATWNCRGRLVVVEKPMVMGILNTTPDSFYEGSRFSGPEIIEQAGLMIRDGADILDIGGQSTRPGSQYLTAHEEADRVIPMVLAVKKAFPETLVSIDSFHHQVAREAVLAGADIINDISGGTMDAEMIPTAATLGVPYVLMHMRGTPQTMKGMAHYDNVTQEVLDYFIGRTKLCNQAGIKDLIIDPGFGFAKNNEHNLQLLAQLSALSVLRLPILAGLSRKSTICNVLQTDAEHALNGTTVMNTVALMNGASILRVHDVREAKETILLTEAIKKSY